MSRLGEGGVWEGGANGIFGQPISDAGAGRLPPGRDEMGAVGGCYSGTHPICLQCMDNGKKSFISGDLGMLNEGLLLLRTEIWDVFTRGAVKRGVGDT